MEGLVLETEVKLASGDLDETPLLKKRYEKFFRFYEDYSESENKVLKMSIIVYLFVKIDFKKEEKKFRKLQDEINNISDVNLVEIFFKQMELINNLLEISAPYKSKICDAITLSKVRAYVLKVRVLNFKKNNSTQNLMILKILFVLIHVVVKIIIDSNFKIEAKSNFKKTFRESKKKKDFVKNEKYLRHAHP